MAPMRLVSIQVGRPRELGPGAPGSRWRTAFLKEPVAGPVHLGRLGLDGDGQASVRIHGGPDQAVLAYAAAHYPLWAKELGRELPSGGFAENFTVEGQDEDTV